MLLLKKPICDVLEKVIAPICSLSFFFLFESGWVETFEIIEFFFSS